MAFTLIQQEQIIYQTPKKTENLTLTSHRVCYHSEISGQTRTVSIMLEDVCSCSAGLSNPWILLLLGIVVIVLGLLILVKGSDAGGVAVLFVGFGIALMIAYFFLRHVQIVVASAGATIRVNAFGMKAPEMAAFVAKVAQAKDDRFQLHRFTYPQRA